jgi:hypothetical protein
MISTAQHPLSASPHPSKNLIRVNPVQKEPRARSHDHPSQSTYTRIDRIVRKPILSETCSPPINRINRNPISMPFKNFTTPSPVQTRKVPKEGRPSRRPPSDPRLPSNWIVAPPCKTPPPKCQPTVIPKRPPPSINRINRNPVSMPFKNVTNSSPIQTQKAPKEGRPSRRPTGDPRLPKKLDSCPPCKTAPRQMPVNPSFRNASQPHPINRTHAPHSLQSRLILKIPVIPFCIGTPSICATASEPSAPSITFPTIPPPSAPPMPKIRPHLKLPHFPPKLELIGLFGNPFPSANPSSAQ